MVLVVLWAVSPVRSARERVLKRELLQDNLVPSGDLELEPLKSPDGPSC